MSREFGGIILYDVPAKQDYENHEKALILLELTLACGAQAPPNENSYTSQMVRTIKYFAELG